MIQYEIKSNGEVVCTAKVDEHDQLEVAIAKLVGYESPVINITAFLSSSPESSDPVVWETQKIEVGDEITITSKEIISETSSVNGDHYDEEDENYGSDMFCSFCGKGNHEINKMIAGEQAFICDECVELCSDIVESEKT